MADSEHTIDKLVIDINVRQNKSIETINGLIESIDNLKSSLSDVQKPVESFANNISKNSKKTTKVVDDVKKMDQPFTDLIAKLGTFAFAIKKSWDYLGKFVKSSNAYIENLNLFNVTFGELNEQANEFVEVYSKTLALDPSGVMRNFGTLNQIATGFGLDRNKSYEIAKTLTQLAYDASSYFNISIADSFLKFKSGLAGELEPLRAIGYALDEATLQQIAYNHGVEKSVRVMTQAEKAQIRTIAIYEQSGNIMNDLAQTLDSPANAMRVLNQQWELFKRSIGNIIVPILTKVLPVMQAFVETLTEAGNAIANFFGYKITGARTEDMITQIDDLGEAYGKLDKNVKGSLLNIDKFSVLNKQDKEDNQIDLDIPTYDALLGAIDSKVESIKKNIKSIIPKDFLDTLKEVANLLSSIIKPLVDLLGDTLHGILEVLTPIFENVINPLIKGISKVAKAIVDLLDKFNLLKPLVIGLIGYFLIFHTKLKTKVADSIMSMIMGTSMLTKKIKLLSLSLGVGGAFGALFGLSALFDSFNNDTRKIASSITLVISAVVGLTTALLAMQGTLSMGIAIPIILTSIGAGIAGLRGLLQDVDGFANGGFTNANIIKTNENGLSEWVGHQGNSKVIVNDKQMDDIMRSAVEQGTYNALSRASTTTRSQDLVLQLDGRELARGSIRDIVNVLNSNYNVNIRPS